MTSSFPISTPSRRASRARARARRSCSGRREPEISLTFAVFPVTSSRACRDNSWSPHGLPHRQVVEADISQKASEVPPPVGNRPPQTVRVDLIAVELEGRLAEGTTFGYWTFNGQRAGADAARSRRRYSRRAREKFGRQQHDPFGRFPRRYRSGRRRGRNPGRSRPREVVQVQSARAGSLCLSLRHADGGAPHRQRHVWAHPGRARRRVAAGRPRVLCDAGRDLYRGCHSGSAAARNSASRSC